MNEMTSAPPVCQAPATEPGKPRLIAPRGTCDSHMHIFPPGDRYPLTPARSFSPPPAPLDHYRRVMAALGIERNVLVQASVHGTDNSMLLDVLRANRESMRGVAVLDSSATDAEIEALDEAGVRGLRVNIPVVIDHMGHQSDGPNATDPGFQDMLALLREGRAWVKLSGAYRISHDPDPPYGDAIHVARTLIETAPDRMVWGTDWPHPAVTKPMPQDAALLDVLSVWTSDAALQRRILVDNPARLYGFPSGGRTN
jgi:predicted TIM-barrel fold metal-dependent hydrolase